VWPSWKGLPFELRGGRGRKHAAEVRRRSSSPELRAARAAHLLLRPPNVGHTSRAELRTARTRRAPIDHYWRPSGLYPCLPFELFAQLAGLCSNARPNHWAHYYSRSGASARYCAICLSARLSVWRCPFQPYS